MDLDGDFAGSSPAAPANSVLLRSEHVQAERLGDGGHATVVRDEPVQVIADLECSRKVKRIKRPQRRRLEKCRSFADRLGGFDDRNLSNDVLRQRRQLGCCTSHGTHNLDFNDRARDLFSILHQQTAQRDTLGLLDDKLDERRRVDVDQIRSSRDSSSTSLSGRSSLTLAGGGRSARLPAPRRTRIPRASSRARRSAATIG